VNNLYLKYNAQTKPVLADRDGEAIVNWTAGHGSHSVTADATHTYSGSKSFKMSTSSSGDFASNYIGLPSGNNSTFSVGSKYVIAIHLYAATALLVQIKTGGVASSSLVCSAGAWTTGFFAFTAATATTEFQMIIVGSGGDVWFELEPIYQGDAFPVLVEKGLTAAEDYSFYPPINNKYIDGTSDAQYKSFIRNANIQTNSLTGDQLKTLLYWNMNLNQDAVLDYDIFGVKEVGLLFPSPPSFEAKRYNNLRLTPYADFKLAEAVARTVFPV
jgi:hypothetical protein